METMGVREGSAKGEGAGVSRGRQGTVSESRNSMHESRENEPRWPGLSGAQVSERRLVSLGWGGRGQRSCARGQGGPQSSGGQAGQVILGL